MKVRVRPKKGKQKQPERASGKGKRAARDKEPAKASLQKDKPKKEKPKKEKQKKDRPKKAAGVSRRETFSLAALSIVAALLIAFFFFLQLGNYDEGVLEIYARQQDGYVQLVLDQINILGDRSTDQIVSDILGTLDNSSGRFWTLSRNEAMVFVRDIAETNSYKGFHQTEYFSSDSAEAFLRSLSQNRVTHELVELNGTVYAASGTVFHYNGAGYTICLMTNREVILDDNLYLNAKINLTVLLFFLLALFLLISLGASLRLDRIWKEKGKTEEDNRELRRMAERLNARLEKKELYDTSLSVFDKSLMPELLNKLFARGVYPFSVVEVNFKSARERKLFLQASQLTMRSDVARFSEGGNTLYIVGLKQQGSTLQEKMESLFPSGMTIKKITDIINPSDISLLGEYLLENGEKDGGK